MCTSVLTITEEQILLPSKLFHPMMFARIVGIHLLQPFTSRTIRCGTSAPRLRGDRTPHTSAANQVCVCVCVSSHKLLYVCSQQRGNVASSKCGGT